MSTKFDDALDDAVETSRTQGFAIDQRAHFAAGARWAKRWLEDNAPDPRQPSLPLEVVTILAGDGAHCRVRVEGDERVCSYCAVRWATGEKAPECGR